MNLELSPESATRWVVWGALMLGLILGAIGQISRFCIRGAIADWFIYGGRARMMMWVLVLVVAATGTQALIGLDVFDAKRTVAWSDRFLWPSYLIGGFVFGYGMVLAAGCPQRSLVKAGAGNLKAIVTLLVAAVAAQMTLRGVFAEARSKTVDAWGVQLAVPQDMGSLIAQAVPTSAGLARSVILALLLCLAAAWLWRHRGQFTRQDWAAGLVIGLLVPAAWLLTGLIGYLPEHPETLEPAWQGTQSRRPEALTFTAPVAHTLDLLTYWSDRNTRLSFGVMLTLGVLIGSHLAARARGELKIESFGNARELRDHLLGGLLMGVGGVTAMGCSVGQGVTGLAMLSAGAVLAVAGLAGGALLALQAQVRQAEAGAA